MQHLKVLLTLAVAAASVSCSVISSEIRAEAEPRAAFGALLENPDAFKGKTVILGGYILDIRVDGDRNLLRVLQAPLIMRDEPAVRSDSQGRFCLVQQGFLEPEIFRPGRKITVAGRVMGMAPAPHGPCLTLEAREIHLWQVTPYRDLPYYPYDEWDYPFFIRRRFRGYHDR
jgi:outer membrane lipoprotein